MGLNYSGAVSRAVVATKGASAAELRLRGLVDPQLEEPWYTKATGQLFGIDDGWRCEAGSAMRLMAQPGTKPTVARLNKSPGI